MIKRKFYAFFYLLLLTAGYVAFCFFIKEPDSLHYISLLFITIGTFLVFFFPVYYPRKEIVGGWMRYRLYLVTGLYLGIVIGCSYVFSYVLECPDKVYFIGHIIGLAVEISLLWADTKYTKKPKEIIKEVYVPQPNPAITGQEIPAITEGESPDESL